MNWTHKIEQRSIVIIILMVPLFGINSYVGLLDMKASETMIMILDSIKECYEAVVIKEFLILMYSLMGIKDGDSIPKNIRGKHIHQVFPLKYFMKDFTLNENTISTLKIWCDQFVYLRPIMSILSLYLQLTNRYDNHYWTITIILNISITLAVTALLMFFHAFEDELKQHRTLSKFLCIKGVVFFAFWQGIILQILEYINIVHSDMWYTQTEVADAIQNLLICLEMGFIFAPAHMYAFTCQSYKAIKDTKKKN